jgi:predicted metal-dependent enzyme (double-stranded beta helix superfamily)
MDLIAAVGEPTQAGITRLYQSKDLTILNLVWAPQMTVRPHDHQMWAVIGIYGGAEDNIFWRREGQKVVPAGAKALRSGDVVPLGRDIVHSVSNPLDGFTGAIHVYGGDFFEAERSEWDPQSLTEMPFSISRTRQMFEDANRRQSALEESV